MSIAPTCERPVRSAPFELEPGYYADADLWLYGNVRLLNASLFHVESALGPPIHLPSMLDELETETEKAILTGKVLVCGIHSPAHQRSAIVPLRWGSPRVVVLSGGFYHHLGEKLDQELFRAARLWRYQWDEKTDLVISRRAPNKLPTYASHNPTVDRLISRVASRQIPGLLFEGPHVSRCCA